MNITLTEADFARLVRAVVDAAPDRRCARCGHGEWFHPWTQDLDADYRAVNSPYQQCAACVHEDRDDCNHDFEPVGAPPVPPQDDALRHRLDLLWEDHDAARIDAWNASKRRDNISADHYDREAQRIASEIEIIAAARTPHSPTPTEEVEGA